MLRTRGEKIFNIFNIVFMIVLSLVVFYPFYYTFIYAFNDGADAQLGNLFFYPRKPTLQNFAMLLAQADVVNAYLVTIIRTLIGSFSSVFFTAVVAYGMSYKELKFKKIYNIIFLIPMFFSGGIIPYYLMIKDIKLYNNFLVFIIPGLFGIWNFILIRTFFNSIPSELEESARMDGAGDFRIFVQMIIPISLPILATVLLYESVAHWNSWMDAYLYVDKKQLYTIQLILKQMIAQQQSLEKMLENSNLSGAMHALGSIEQIIASTGVTSRSLQAAASILTIGPIVLVYPFLQKYFIKGVMIGSLKG